MFDIILPIPADNRILFFKRDRADFGFLSNFYDAPIVIEGETWRSVEFYYQAQKSHDPGFRDAIRNAETPGHAKRLGSDPRRSKNARKRSWFQVRIDALRADWPDVRFGVMEVALCAKFFQNPQLQAKLLATADAEIVEDSKYDAVWGVGRDGRGENRLGRMLMRLREQVRDGSTGVGSAADQA